MPPITDEGDDAEQMSSGPPPTAVTSAMKAKVGAAASDRKPAAPQPDRWRGRGLCGMLIGRSTSRRP